MLYEPNTRDWEPGDFVIHDCDAKKTSMIMRVIKTQKNGMVVTEYMSDYTRDFTGHKKFKNDKKYLHDPDLFGIDVSKKALKKLCPSWLEKSI